MAGPAISIHDARQLQRLRALRLQRAREAAAAATAAQAAAADAVRACEAAVAADRRALEALAQALVSGLAAQLPRWADVAGAQRERLVDRLERDEDALITAEERLEQAEEAAQAARAALTRALAREDAGQGLLLGARRQRMQRLEQQAELEAEDQGRRPAAWRGGAR